ncbi:MAG: PAS domain-containing protein, partial [Pseudohongiellaceae bacterium]
MTISLLSVVLTVTLYMGCMFGLAWITRANRLPAWLVNNPLIYVLSLGISINTWSFYTSIAVASDRGYGYLAYYIGYSVAFLFAAIFLQPILHVTKTYQLSSMADLFSFRFRSPLAGSLTTLVLLTCIFPLVSLQILAVAQSAKLLLPEVNTYLLAFAFCSLAFLFTIIFGASDHSGRDKHQGVVMALAFETVIKLLALSILGLYAIYGVFGGFAELDGWLEQVPDSVSRLDLPFFESSTNLVVLLFFTAAIAMPHMYHMTFKENSNPGNLKIASWGLPLILLMAAIPALPVLWASEYLGSSIPVEYSAIALGILQESSLLTFTGGIAAATGITVVIALALSNMCLNHLILPLHKPDSRANLYDWLLFRRRLLIGAIILGCYLSYLLIADGYRVVDMGYVSFIACVQFLPGIITLLYWPTGNRNGFIAGLATGASVWFFLGLLPLFTSVAITDLSYATGTEINWTLVASLSLIANMLMLILFSLLTPTSDQERRAGEMCSMERFRRPRRQELAAKTPLEFVERLSRPLGEATAKREVMRALKDLGLNRNESRPYPIQQLRDQLEANLSGLLGPTIANQIIDRFLPFELVSDSSSLDVSFIESRLEAYPGNLSGVAVDLDNLRRHHRQILQDLPLGVCSIGINNEVTMWNTAMEKLTSIADGLIIGNQPDTLPEPWKNLLQDFIEDESSAHLHKRSLLVDNRQRWLSLHKATIEKTTESGIYEEGLVIVIEDLTETELLEAELTHAERLASIGRLAAGVAHEIGNPTTAIACLAQNIRDETSNPDLMQMAEQIIKQ